MYGNETGFFARQVEDGVWDVLDGRPTSRTPEGRPRGVLMPITDFDRARRIVDALNEQAFATSREP